jgi:hypothetical protein
MLFFRKPLQESLHWVELLRLARFSLVFVVASDNSLSSHDPDITSGPYNPFVSSLRLHTMATARLDLSKLRGTFLGHRRRASLRHSK